MKVKNILPPEEKKRPVINHIGKAQRHGEQGTTESDEPCLNAKNNPPIIWKTIKQWQKRKELWKHYDEIKERGIKVDLDDLQEMLSEYEKELKKGLKEMFDEFVEDVDLRV